MELRQLRYFIAVAEERHFGRAAQRLGMAQPPLSQQIRQLEDQLGVTLLERTTRRVDLTPAGQELLERGRAVLAEIATLEADVHRIGAGTTGVLRLGCCGAATYASMPRVLRGVAERLPGVALTVQGEMSDAAVESGLRERTLDLGLLHPPVATPGIEHRVVGRERLVVAVPQGSPLVSGRGLAVGDLREQLFVGHPAGSPVQRVVDELCRGGGFQPRVAQSTPEISAMLSLVAAGQGVAVVPEQVRALRLDGVVYEDLADAAGPDLVLAWRGEDRSAVLRGVLELVVELAEQW
ncbi:LysR substrate-binding domain-containing protein [Glutamicibacter protophormiae]|nr:LysR substrate-binding domain-containing protein [Glutamicibacter protophormiae]